MSNLSEQHRLDPNDPAYYAPRRLRERARSPSSPSHETASQPFSDPISPEAPFGNMVSGSMRHPISPPIIHEGVGFGRDGRRAALYGVGALLFVGFSAIAILFFVIMAPVSQQSDAAPTSSEIAPPVKVALPHSGQDEGSKPAIADFQGLIAPAIPSENTTHEQSDQLLQKFLQWRKKPDSAETSR